MLTLFENLHERVVKIEATACGRKDEGEMNDNGRDYMMEINEREIMREGMKGGGNNK